LTLQEECRRNFLNQEGKIQKSLEIFQQMWPLSHFREVSRCQKERNWGLQVKCYSSEQF
jgi:hypothetical protein